MSSLCEQPTITAMPNCSFTYNNNLRSFLYRLYAYFYLENDAFGTISYETPQVTNQNNNPVQIMFTLAAKLFSVQNHLKNIISYNCMNSISIIIQQPIEF